MTGASGKRVALRLDATAAIGTGHAVRCEAIAQAVADQGGEALFAVSCDESAAFVRSLGRDASVLGGDPMALGVGDGLALARWCAGERVDAVLVDTYAAGGAFFGGLAGARAEGLRAAYLDDLYTFADGNLAAPAARPVDLLLNYSLYADERVYGAAYAGSGARLLLGPAYAPLRRGYRGAPEHALRPEVADVLVTTGSTNPRGVLERLAGLARAAFPGAAVHVVVGARASFEGPADGLDLLGPQPTLLPLMERCDACVSAAGTTLYELCALGVPTVAAAITANQEQNARALSARGLGLGFGQGATDAELSGAMGRLREDAGLRGRLSARMRGTVPGDGAARIAAALMGE